MSIRRARSATLRRARRVTMPTSAQRRVVRATALDPFGSRARPVIRRVAQVADCRHTASPPSGGGAARSVWSLEPRPSRCAARDTLDRPAAARPQRASGGDASPDPWHGADDGDVRMLALVPRRRRLRLERVQQPCRAVARLSRRCCGDQLDARQQQRRCARRRPRRRRAPVKTRRVAAGPGATAAAETRRIRWVAQQPFQAALRQPPLRGGRRRVRSTRPRTRASSAAGHTASSAWRDAIDRDRAADW